MMLYITIKVAMERKNRSGDLLPSTRYELYEAFVSTLFSHQEEKGKDLCADRTQIENSLTELYFKLQCRKEIRCKYSEALKFVKNSEDFTLGKISPQAVLKDCFKLGLLAKNDYYVSYGIHQSFQEYFAALKLKELFESGFDVSETFSHPKWEEVVIFTSEMLGSDFINEFVGSMLLKGELFLASKCVNKANEKIKEKLCDLLVDKMDSRYELERRNSIESLGRIGNFGICIIIDALKDENFYVRGSAAKALGNIKSDTAVQPLINALKDEDEYVRRSAAKALENICTVKNKMQLEDLLESDHKFSVNTAFRILHEIEKEEKSKLILFKDLKKRSKMTPKYSIFVSSVQKELENERVTIQDLVESDPFLSEHYTSLLYEYEPAYPEKTLEGCLNAINRCQAYLLIVGMKYGTLAGEISITHREYRYAKEKNLPILVFIKG